MNLDKKRSFIINVLYFGLMVVIVFVLLKYAVPLLAPFLIGFAIAYLLKRPIRFVSTRLKANRKLVAILMVLVFYCTIGLLIVLLSIKAFTAAGDFLQRLPSFYTFRVEPVLMNILTASSSLCSAWTRRSSPRWKTCGASSSIRWGRSYPACPAARSRRCPAWRVRCRACSSSC